MKKSGWICLIILSVLTITSFGLAYLFNTGGGAVVVKTVVIEDSSANISGLLYIPNPEGLPHSTLLESSDYDLPAVVLIHGVMNAKEAMSSLALELARNGIVALSIDALGHGNSEGETRSVDDPSLGGLTALNYLKSLPFVNTNQIGVIGHSMGVGAIRATSLNAGNISAHIFIGGVGSSNSSLYGELNYTSPSNLLVAIGKYDELFNLTRTFEDLKPIFGTNEEIETDRLYGSFANQTARKIITPNTIHLFEPISHVILKESVDWLSNVFGLLNENKALLSPFRDLFLFIGMITLLGLSFPLLKLVMRLPVLEPDVKKENKLNFKLWKIEGTWSLLHLVLFVPPILVFGMGAYIFPLSLGTTAVIWMLLLVIVGSIMILISLKRKEQDLTIKEKLAGIVQKFTSWKGLLIILGLCLLTVGLVVIVEILSLSLKMFVPLYSSFTVRRIWMFLIMLPFIFLYFAIDSIIMTGTYSLIEKDGSALFSLGATSKVVGIKILPLVLVLIIQYVPLFGFNFRVLTGFLGFSMQFIIMLVPLFVIFTLIELWFYKITKDLLPGALMNAFLLSWTLSILLPFAPLA